MITKVTITPPLPINLYLLLFIFYQTYQNKIDKMFRIWEEGNLRIPIKTSFNQSLFFSRLSPLEVTLLHFENQMSFPLILKWMNYVLLSYFKYYLCNANNRSILLLLFCNITRFKIEHGAIYNTSKYFIYLIHQFSITLFLHLIVQFLEKCCYHNCVCYIFLCGKNVEFCRWQICALHKQRR